MEEHVGYVHERIEEIIRHNLYLKNGFYYWSKGVLTLPTRFRDGFDKENYMMIVTLNPPRLSYSPKTF